MKISRFTVSMLVIIVVQCLYYLCFICFGDHSFYTAAYMFLSKHSLAAELFCAETNNSTDDQEELEFLSVF